MDGVSIKAGALFDAYKQWAADNVPRIEDRMNQNAFGRKMQSKFAFREGRHTIYFGVSLDPEAKREVA